MSKVTYFTSRAAARNAVVDGTRFKDFGADAPKGERWATIAVPSAKPTLRTAATKTRSPRANTKKAIALDIMRKMFAKDATRQEILAELQVKVGLTAAGSSTYYAQVKSGAWSL